ncbi:hypothetical protein KUV50_12590 [Membranicola marinus]|uniref:Uncharacterized protein n=1 Tax=Membranihabitans marinus TaxID=1227546 RepID=A0A953HYG8_9BACT|nr:hypothetical protein [Membranihabitans marinus]MBY5958981.1 hypothetical protein [Membranihabitans marinus]
MARRIYSIITAISILIIIYLISTPVVIGEDALFWIVIVLYSVIVGSVHGLLSHSISSKKKDALVFYPFLMGGLFMALLLIYIFLILPFVIPGFM